MAHLSLIHVSNYCQESAYVQFLPLNPIKFTEVEHIRINSNENRLLNFIFSFALFVLA